jgi:hypothetical protein
MPHAYERRATLTILQLVHVTVGANDAIILAQSDY